MYATQVVGIDFPVYACGAGCPSGYASMGDASMAGAQKGKGDDDTGQGTTRGACRHARRTGSDDPVVGCNGMACPTERRDRSLYMVGVCIDLAGVESGDSHRTVGQASFFHAGGYRRQCIDGGDESRPVATVAFAEHLGAVGIGSACVCSVGHACAVRVVAHVVGFSMSVPAGTAAVFRWLFTGGGGALVRLCAYILSDPRVAAWGAWCCGAKGRGLIAFDA